MSGNTTFHVEINKGPVQIFETKTGQYTLAALASLAMLDFEAHPDYEVVKIWVPDLVEGGYGPYFIAWDGHRVGFPDDDRKW